MSRIDILLQGEAIDDIQLVSIENDSPLAAVLAEAAKLRGGRHGAGDDAEHGDFLVYEQDEDAPLKRLPKPKPGIPLCLHVSRCRKVEVHISFNGRTQSAGFAPSRTVGAIKTYAARKLFGMSEHDAAEHVLQISESDTRPDIDIHIGTLARRCTVAFDLVPLVRVEG